jgi:hypothetical protein
MIRIVSFVCPKHEMREPLPLLMHKKLPKYDWSLVYTTPAAHRIFTKAQMEKEETVLTNKEDNHFVIITVSKTFVPSTGSVWASEPVPDESNLAHYLPVWKTPLTDLQGKPRAVDDHQPCVQIALLYKEGSLDMGNSEAIEDFARKYAVEEDLVNKAIEHCVGTERR